jgi:hypothetical protein
MKINSNWVTGLWLVGLGACLTTASCDKPKEQPSAPVSAADKAAADKAAADKAAADKAAADKAAADKTAAAVAAAEKSAASKTAAEKAAADKAAADKAAAEKAVKDAQTATASLPEGLIQLKSEVSRAVAQIDVTMAKLDVLSTSSGDLKEPSKSALEAIEALDKEAQAITKRADEMRELGATYFEAWEKQLSAMTTPGVVAVATKRKDELAAGYAQVLTAMQDSRSSFDSYWTDMQAIQKAIDDGLKPESLKALAPQIKAAKDKATTLKGRIEAVTSKLDLVSVIYTKP